MRRSIAMVFAALALVLVAVVPTADAALTVQRTWRAGLGTSSAHGTVVMVAYTDGTGSLATNLLALRPHASYAPQVRGGTCAKPGTVLVNYAGMVTDATGAVSAGHGISNHIMNKIWGVARGGYINIRYKSGTSIVCGNLKYIVATRIRFPAEKIDLPIVRGPSGYPYCNVAMYMPILWQPAEPGVTFIYAHARTGMFLPILTASKINNGKAMLDKVVYVYTSDSMVYTYRVSAVDRHIRSVQRSLGITSQKLWLQTSEGTNYTFPKVVLEANLVAVGPATYAASHPKPHIVHCT